MSRLHLLPVLALVALLASPAAAAPAKVVIIGLDGVSLNLLKPYAKSGATPNLGRFLDEGAYGDLASIWPLRTPQVWTSVVTGKVADQHGIWDHLSNTWAVPHELRTKGKRLITTADRRSKTLWNILDDKGLKTLSVGWMASWPAEKLKNGIMVAPTELRNDNRQTTIKGSFYSDAANMVWPTRLEKRVRNLIVDPADVTDLGLFGAIPKPGDPLLKFHKVDRYVYALRWSHARAQSVEAITLDLAASASPDVVLSYFQCTDSLLHRFWIFQMGEERTRKRLKTHGLDPSKAAALVNAFKDVVDACYRDVDKRVGRLLKATQGPDTLVLIVSDHGFGDAPVPHKLKSEPYSGDHLDDGILLAMGPGVPKGKRLPTTSVLDITPTVLRFLGHPVGDDMRGKSIPELINNEPEKRIPTYEAKPQLTIAHPNGFPPRKKARRTEHVD